ncbi:hypothetical protein FHS83_002253 [Rhizomicrobium palustre]|uniref:Uncharacterized protein n=1 Tax=Rhizomicrobium palustre TaxID=189966 RepID=A0A846N0C1_9PROT|nr:hypothetical protein [Rhizomicrobium palustre]
MEGRSRLRLRRIATPPKNFDFTKQNSTCVVFYPHSKNLKVHQNQHTKRAGEAGEKRVHWGSNEQLPLRYARTF